MELTYKFINELHIYGLYNVFRLVNYHDIFITPMKFHYKSPWRTFHMGETHDLFQKDLSKGH